MKETKCPMCGKKFQTDFVRRGFIERFKKLNIKQMSASIASSKRWLKLMEDILKQKKENSK